MRTNKADRNWISFTEDEVWYYLGTSFDEQVTLPVPTDMIPTTPSDWDAVLKVSHNTAPLRLENLRVAQGRENAVDLNHHPHDIYLSGIWGYGGGIGDQVVTIKGGARRITIAGPIYSEGRIATVVLGEWSDQSTDLSSDIDLSSLSRADGQPVRIIMSRVNRRTVRLPANVQVLQWQSLLHVMYWWGKRVWVAIRYGWW